MSYSMGDVPLILQGAAQRESGLTQDQLDRLNAQSSGAQMLPELTTTVKGGWVVPLLLGIAGAWVIAGQSKGRHLWSLLFFLLLSTPVFAQMAPLVPCVGCSGGIHGWDTTGIKLQQSVPAYVIISMDDPPVSLSGNPSINGVFDTITAAFVGESLRVVMAWTQPTDSGGLADSTMFNFKSTKSGVFQRGSTPVVANVKLRRKVSNPLVLADTFKLVKPAVNDSVLFTVDGITQCRKGKCSLPGGAGWGYFRTLAPPAMTFIRVTVDSF